jgi:uncharacterized membrane protein
MDPTLRVATALLLFAATHLGIASTPLRGWLVARIGPHGFTWAFSLLAWLSFGVFASTYAAHANEGPPGFALGAAPALRAALIAVVVLGVMLMAGAFGHYGSSPYAIGGERVREPRGLERVTRHPFFVGAGLVGAAHALLATRATGAVAIGGIGLVGLLGAWLQDRKLLALRGEPFADYLAASSLLPFAAIAAGRQRLVVSELPWTALALGLALAWGLRGVHAQLFDHGGAYVIAALVVGPLVILVRSTRRDRRREASHAGATRLAG